MQCNKNGSSWKNYASCERISLKQNEYVQFRGSGLKLAEKVGNKIYDNGSSFEVGGSLSDTGCVDSLRLKSLDSNYGKFQGLDAALYVGMFEDIFSGNPSLKAAPELRTTVLAEFCYEGMFGRCTSLTSAPALPTQSLAADCYWHMFNRCSSLNLSKTRDFDHLTAVQSHICLYTFRQALGHLLSHTF